MAPAEHPGPGTLHERLIEPLLRRIESGELSAGCRLPTEAQLMRDHRVSRTTARRALDELRERGLVSREAGRGTVVATPGISVDLPCLHTLAAAIERTGQAPGARLLTRERQPAGAAVASRLGIAARDPVLHVRLLCTAGGRPIVLCDSYLNLARFPGLAGAGLPLLSLLEAAIASTGERIHGARHWVGAEGARAEVARLLEMRRTAPVLHLGRIVHVGDGVALETARVDIHPVRCRGYGEVAWPLEPSASGLVRGA
jgi:DNA-binding GntR family transcriptional regulator